MRLIAGLLVAPIVPGMLFGLLGEFTDGSVGLWWCVTFSAAAGYPVAILLGIPLFFALRRRRYQNLGVYTVAGALLGLVPYLVAVLPGMSVSILTNDKSQWYAATGILSFLPLSMLCGAIASGSFWLIARPDKLNTEDKLISSGGN